MPPDPNTLFESLWKKLVKAITLRHEVLVSLAFIISGISLLENEEKLTGTEFFKILSESKY